MAIRDEIVTVLGASGFLGRHVVRALARAGYRIRAACRRPNLAQFLRPMGAVGQIDLVRADIRDEESLARLLERSHAAVNLVGILQEAGGQRFAAIHADGAERVARLAGAAGIDRLVHVSAIGADQKAASAYARTKGDGEAAVRAILPSAAVLRPSVVFGPEDEFFNRFANLARYLPALPLIAGGRTRFQPVYVSDVAAAVLAALGAEARGRIYELGGPRVMTFKEVLELILEVTHRKRLLVPTPLPFAYLAAALAELSPTRFAGIAPPITVDEIRLLESDNVVGSSGDGVGTLADLGIARPAAPEAIVESYLWRYRKGGQFEASPA
ncbi:MAG: complex I NDUFA9 subunit family protein [Alphaproteobacteria bacterium]|nr:complex I NDUFA9 subunit family protein [Alphaproteobacteria bacterium]